MSTIRTFRIVMQFPAELKQAAQALRLSEMPKIHPLIEKMDLSKDSAALSEAIITDKLKLGFLQFPLVYKASNQLLRSDASCVEFDNRSFAPLLGRTLETHSHLRLQQAGENCHLQEETEMFFPPKAAWMPTFIWQRIQDYALYNAQSSHQKMFENLVVLLAKN